MTAFLASISNDPASHEKQNDAIRVTAERAGRQLIIMAPPKDPCIARFMRRPLLIWVGCSHKTRAVGRFVHMRRPRMLLAAMFLVAVELCADAALAQPSQKKIRLSLSSTTVALLPTFAAYDKGFFRDEGFDVELIQMPATLASTAQMTGDLDYNGAVSGVISAAVQGRPVRCLVCAVA
jgi:hypothetical protein